MPYALGIYDWRILRVEQLKPGDLLFKGKESGSISHVGMVVSSEQVFHIVHVKGCIKQKVDNFLLNDKSEIDTCYKLYHIRDTRGYGPVK